jgi:hypothetical protein
VTPDGHSYNRAAERDKPREISPVVHICQTGADIRNAVQQIKSRFKALGRRDVGNREHLGAEQGGDLKFGCAIFESRCRNLRTIKLFQ